LGISSVEIELTKYNSGLFVEIAKFTCSSFSLSCATQSCQLSTINALISFSTYSTEERDLIAFASKYD
jgi:hypothetical protein